MNESAIIAFYSYPGNAIQFGWVATNRDTCSAFQQLYSSINNNIAAEEIAIVEGK